MIFKNYFLALFVILFTQNIYAQNALSFDGIDDKVDLGTGANLNLAGTTLTIEAWIYPTSWRTNVYEGGIVVKEQNIQAGYMFRAGQSGRLNFAFGSGGAGATWKELTTAANVLSLNVWQHVAVTYDGSKVRLYKNGVRIDSTNYTGSVGVNSNSCVIGGWYSTGRNFPGKIDEVRIWNIVRSQSQIASSMNGEFCSAPTGMVAYYKFNQGNAGNSNTGLTTLIDGTGNSNGTLQGFALTGSTSNWTTGATLTPGAGGSATTSVLGCDSYTSPSGNHVWTTSGTYIDTVSSALGCDSILTINLTMGASNAGTLTTTGCNNYTSPSGNNVWTTSGTYTDILTNASGCDSVLTINLTINTVDINVLQNGATLTSWATGASYQWLDCNNGFAAVAGATSQVFKPSANGSYAVRVDKNNCVDTSACFAVTNIGLLENELQNSFVLFPNPAKNQLTIKFNAMVEKATAEIVNTHGQVLYIQNLKNSDSAELQFDLPAGVYFLRLTADDKMATKKIVIE